MATTNDVKEQVRQDETRFHQDNIIRLDGSYSCVALDLVCTTDDETGEVRSYASGFNCQAIVLTLAGPGGGHPLVLLAGVDEDVRRLVADYASSAVV